MGAGGEELKIETKAILAKREKSAAKKSLLVSVEPGDRFHIVYIIMIIQGVGTLLPWNMFITAHAYFVEKLKGSIWNHDFENYFSVAAMAPNLVMFLLNTLFKHKVSLQVRMISSVCIMTLCFVLTTALVVIDTSDWTTEFFIMTLGTIIIINMFSAIYQGGLFGLCGMMPQKYTGAVMTGQGVGGTFAALASILSLLGGKDAKSSGFGYFMSAAIVLALCLVSYFMLHKLKFARFYIAQNDHRKEIKFPSLQADQTERLANWRTPPSKKSGDYKHSTLSLDQEVLLAVNVEKNEVEVQRNERPPFLLVFKKIAKFGLSVATVFFVTLAAFPSLTSRIQSVNKEDNSQWTNKENNYNVMDVWSMNYTGAGIVVAVVDEGLNTTHPELSKAYDRNASRDFVEDDAIPEPNDAYIMSGHGSKCAGVIAAKGNNGHCGVGLAYNARIGGIRLFKNAMATDMTEADALSFNRDYIHIYSNSWGPDDRGFEVKGPGKATKEKLKEGATEGRKGKGSIFVFAAGNGGIISKDSCAYNGYVNSIYTIAISSVNRDGSVPLYGERCPGIMATAFSRDSFGDRNPVVTAGQNGQCEFFFGGSSASAAMASGLIALTLEANTNLTWRDVQHIIARSARFPRRYPSDLVTNGAGLKVSNYIGFGLMDALKMVNFAQKWNNVPKQRQCEIFQNDSTNDRSHTSEINLRSWPYSCGVRIRFLEHVQVRVNLEVWPRGDLLLSLKSPSGTVSRLTQHRPFDRFQSISKNLTDWVILTLHHWGEDPEGTWKLKIHGNYRSLKFSGWSLVLYGTSSDPLKDNPHVHSTPPVSKKPDSTRKETGYIVEITTGYRNRHGYQYTRPIRSDAKIQLFGEDGETVQHRLTPSGSSKSSQLYYIRDNQVGNLTKVQIIKEKGDGKTYYVNEVAIRQEGNNSWIVLQHKGYLWRHGSVTTIKRACQRGFQRGYKDECVDINECDGRNNDCPRINGECVNTHGSYYCKCKPGFQLHESRYRSYDGTWRRWKTCSDINECHRGISGCSHRCENDQGSYHCTCPTGFRLYNGRTCHDINECREGSHGCDHECSNTQGSYDCKCKTGFHLSRYNSKTCFDIDECHRGISGCSHTCQNDQGSYHCTCPIGFQLLHDQRTCTCPKGFKLSHDQRKCLGLDCIRVGSWVWGLWTQKGNSTNYFRARITRIEDNLIEFFLEVNNKQSRRYNRTTPVLIVDKIPDTVSVDERVIAVHKSRKPEWYRTGTVKSTDTATNGKLQALVKFDNGDERLAELNQIRSVKRPRVCMDNI